MACSGGERNARKQGENQNVTEEWKGGGAESRRAYIQAQIYTAFPFQELTTVTIQ